ncbi:hypothetical protein K502DRAFT_362769 [Neoconidiobolus thromboides FSU 785]|nr:hypothetical protein K502DRAFT_362769 [Neoconidiobolus thromboides FSU 785]
MNELEQICQQLDQELIEYMELLTTYETQRKRTNFLLHNGFLELAHSKYILGSNKISQFQYDKRMQASTKLDIISEDLIPLNEDTDPKLNKLKFVMTTNNVENNAEASTFTSANDSQPIRQRNNLLELSNKSTSNFDFDSSSNYNKHDKGDKTLIELKQVQENKKNKFKDPILWFGVLSPPSLKNSQANFIQAILELSSLGNLILALKFREEKIMQLKEKKKRLLQLVET